MFDPKQQMITVKKADGTFSKVPLSEFKKMQAASKPKEISNIQYPISNKSHHIKPMSRADAGSPLEEKLKIKSSAPLFSPKREKQVEEVLEKIGFSVMPEVLGRLKSLVLAKLKDIKSEDETRELLVRSIKNGGLGLTGQQVEKIIKSCQEVEDGEDGEDSGVPALKGKTNMSLMVEPPELPMVIDPTLTLPLKREGIVATPLFKEGQGEVKRFGGTQKQEVVSKLVNSSIANESVFKLDTRPAMKQSMQDVTASSNEMGPVEEIKSISLADFRRLSSNPEEAAKRLQQKMFNLQEESFVWYLDALSAYHNSPLYLDYIQSVCQSLAERKSLANVLAMKNSIKLNEAMAIVEMERSL